ncbi:Cys-Xaa-Xaa-Xaa repeat radical SAM target protein [Prevotella sp. PCHR]|uniref:Cys-Xaa-Xaa-Xaa repeat radical SAM target protein n=1 Tax=Xylanibacter caecicola TaxID=2736294 RepID=A0ABX2B0W3_9BACT|nr:Cys-Xaa-Xaa-Xaa repeat radical SAM target protein [Xylanibacter caecicola]NPE24677.1 Cys-Xaa-Xaa-Xaa repeat radical SAM target protein [Xylanibacter caecicola]
MKNKNNELQSRREFFKKAAKGILPLIGGIILAGSPSIVKAAETIANDCRYTCEGGCNSCKGTCEWKCQDDCSGSCKGGCKRTCKGDCYRQCTSSNYR